MIGLVAVDVCFALIIRLPGKVPREQLLSVGKLPSPRE